MKIYWYTQIKSIMKKLFIISAIAGMVALTVNRSEAQVSLNVNIGTQPAWVPAGYERVNYYYLPEVSSYYHVPQRQFVYLNGNRWVRSRYLPSRYRGYNLNRGRKVVVYGNNPYHHYDSNRVRYTSNVRSYYGGRGPVNYRSPGNHRGYEKHYNNRNYNSRVHTSSFASRHRNRH